MGKNTAIILAAGKGTRMGAGINKQYLNMKDKPVLYYTIKAFSECNMIDEIIIVAAKEEIEYCRSNIIDRFELKKVSKIVCGGSERKESVYNGLKAIEKTDIVLIHDGARPFVTKDIIKNGIDYAKKYNSSACGVVPKDTIKRRDDNMFSDGTLQRDKLFCIQTPQCFKYDIILECHDKIRKEDINITDDTMVVEKYNHKVYLYEGSYDNIKITTPEDLIFGEIIINKNNVDNI